MENQNCITCLNGKAQLVCGICQSHICKKCAHFVDETQTLYMTNKPEVLKHTTFCGACYDAQVAQVMDAYEQTLARAREILVFDKSQGKETRFISRKESIIKVTDCSDYDEALLRFAFIAAQLNFNAIIDVDLHSRKVKTGSYQTQLWDGTARPANVSEHKLMKDRAIWDNPN